MASVGTSEAAAPCPECGGEQVEANVSRYVAVEVNDPAKFFGTRSTFMRAIVCTDCGYTRFYAEQPEKLRVK